MKKILLLNLCSFILITISAQSNMVGINLKAYEPMAGFKQNLSSIPFGISANYLRNSDNSPLSYGLELGAAVYNCEEQSIVYKDVDTPVIKEDGFFTLHAVARYTVLDLEWSQFYGEGKMGMTMFISTLTPNGCEESEFNGSAEYHGTAFNLGLGGGILLNPTVFTGLDNESIYWIDFGVTSFSGSSSTYSINSNEVKNSDTPTANSFTHYMDYRIGLIIKL